MMKKITAVLLAVMIGISACLFKAGAENSENENNTYSLEDCTAKTECIVLCVYEGKADDCCKFKVVRMLKGNIDGKYFYVTNTGSYGDGFIAGTKYVLYLDKEVSVYYTRDIFTPTENIYFSADSKNNITGVTIDGVFYEELQLKTVSSLTKYTDSVKSVCAAEDNFIRSENFDTIYEESDIIVKAKVVRRVDEFSDGIGIYECTLSEKIKGDISEKFSAILFDNRVRNGNEYYFLFDEKTDKGFYVLSSKKSIYGANDKRFSS